MTIPLALRSFPTLKGTQQSTAVRHELFLLSDATALLRQTNHDCDRDHTLFGFYTPSPDLQGILCLHASVLQIVVARQG